MSLTKLSKPMRHDTDRPIASRRARRRTHAMLGMFSALAAWLALSAACMAAQPPRTLWMTATMDGRKVGYLHYQRTRDAKRVVTESTLKIRFARTTQPLDIRNVVHEVESRDGVPLSFSASTMMSGENSSAVGKRIGPGQFQVTMHVGERAREYRMSWPKGALLDNGTRQAIVAHGFAPGTRYTLDRFNASTQAVSEQQVEVVGKESVELPGGVRQLYHLRQTRQDQRSQQVTDVWVDDRGDVLKIGMPLFGFRLELLACSESCATAPDQHVNILDHAMVMLPRPLPRALRQQPIRFTFRVNSMRIKPFIATDMQKVERFGRNVWIVTTVPPRKGIQRRPTAADLAPNDWLQSDAPGIEAAARTTIEGARNDRRRMVLLTRWVRDHVKQEGASVGYASALETLRTGRGDCTEYAVLLAAMARASGIPARVVTGLVYADRYNGNDYVLIPHTWVQAWVDGVWRDYDAATSSYDRTHIAMDVGDGDPWKYFSGISALGSINLLRVRPGINIGEDRPMSPAIPDPSATPPVSGGGMGLGMPGRGGG